MPQYHEFLARHGESAVQAILDNLEYVEGMRSEKIMSLEERWERLMQIGAERRHAA